MPNIRIRLIKFKEAGGGGLAILLILISGMWSLMILFSDYGGMSTQMWYLFVISSHVMPGFVVGMLLPFRWYLSVLAAWGAMFWLFLPVILPLFNPEVSFTLGSLNWWSFGLLVIVALTALAGYAGSRVMKSLSRGKGEGIKSR